MVNQVMLLETMARSPAAAVKQFAEAIIPQLEPIEVLANRTGLAMLPMTDPAHGTLFYLGEVLIAEAHVRLASAEGYAACLGRDLEQALAIALLDAALAAGVAADAIFAFAAAQRAALDAADAALDAQIAATRVEMETF